MSKRIIASVLATTLLVGCAKRAQDIQATYVTPYQYDSLSCEQLRQEMKRVSDRVTFISGEQDDRADGDAVAVGVGTVLFWPALFFIARDDYAEELGTLKGEYEAIQTTAANQNCDLNATIVPADTPSSNNVTVPTDVTEPVSPVVNTIDSTKINQISNNPTPLMD